MYQSSSKNSDRCILSQSPSPTASSSSSRWVCPNDRILALRAKLDTGWSVRSNQITQSPSSSSPSSPIAGSSNQIGFKSGSGYKSLNRFDTVSEGEHSTNRSGSNSPQIGLDLDTLDQPHPPASLLSSSPTMASIDSTVQNGRSFEGRSFESRTFGCRSFGAVSSFDSPANSSISESEQEMILSVITRSQQLEQLEKDRIEKLIDRLNNLKRNAKGGDGRSHCSLCSEKFSFIFGSKLHFCKDCQKAVCSKCSLDTVTATGETIWFCKICSETREMWKKSGAWFFKSIPYYYSNAPEEPGSSYRNRTGSTSTASTISSTGRKFSSCKESTSSHMYQSPTHQVSTHQVSTHQVPTSAYTPTTTTTTTTTTHQASTHNYSSTHNTPTHYGCSNHSSNYQMSTNFSSTNQVSTNYPLTNLVRDPSPSNSMVSIDSIATINSITTYNSTYSDRASNNYHSSLASNPYYNHDRSYGVPSIASPTESTNTLVSVTSPPPHTKPEYQWTSGTQPLSPVSVTSPAADENTFLASASGGFTRNKYNANSIRILSTRSPIRRKGSSRRQPRTDDSSTTFQTMACPEADAHVSDSPETDAFQSALASKLHSKRFGVHAKTSEFTASLKVKRDIPTTELWELASDSSDK